MDSAEAAGYTGGFCVRNACRAQYSYGHSINDFVTRKTEAKALVPCLNRNRIIH